MEVRVSSGGPKDTPSDNILRDGTYEAVTGKMVLPAVIKPDNPADENTDTSDESSQKDNSLTMLALAGAAYFLFFRKR